jgi:parallel beta-helix repeat protein
MQKKIPNRSYFAVLNLMLFVPIFLVIFPFFIEVSPYQSMIGDGKTENIQCTRLKSSNGVTDPPIYLDGNNAVDSFCEGNGTSGNSTHPHIIEDFRINSGTLVSGIELRNINKSLIIRNCTCISSKLSSDSGGIVLYNCSNILIVNSTSYENFHGIFLDNSSKNTISVLVRDNFHGIFIKNSIENTIYNVNSSFNTWRGISLTNSHGNIITNNSIMYNEDEEGGGILLTESRLNIIDSNNISHNLANGVRLVDSDWNNITGNRMEENHQYAIRLDNSTYNRIQGNEFNNNQMGSVYYDWNGYDLAYMVGIVSILITSVLFGTIYAIILHFKNKKLSGPSRKWIFYPKENVESEEGTEEAKKEEKGKRKKEENHQNFHNPQIFRNFLKMGLFFLLICIIAIIFQQLPRLIGELFLYPILLISIIMWIKFVQKDEIRPILLKKSKMPIKEHYWFIYLVLMAFGINIFIIGLKFFFIFANGGPEFIPQNDFTISSIIYSVFMAPIMEEIIFRGYFYIYLKKINEDSYKLNKNRFLLAECVISSVLFGVWHFYDILLIFLAFFFGLFLCKIRNEFGESLLVNTLLHSIYNLAGIINLI